MESSRNSPPLLNSTFWELIISNSGIGGPPELRRLSVATRRPQSGLRKVSRRALRGRRDELPLALGVRPLRRAPRGGRPAEPVPRVREAASGALRPRSGEGRRLARRVGEGARRPVAL